MSLHYNGANSYLFVNGVETIKFKVSGIIPKVLCFRNVSKDFSARSMKKKKTGLYGTVYDFSANYGAILVDDILRICKYLIKKTQYSIKNLNL